MVGEGVKEHSIWNWKVNGLEKLPRPCTGTLGNVMELHMPKRVNGIQTIDRWYNLAALFISISGIYCFAYVNGLYQELWFRKSLNLIYDISVWPSFHSNTCGPSFFILILALDFKMWFTSAGQYAMCCNYSWHKLAFHLIVIGMSITIALFKKKP